MPQHPVVRHARAVGPVPSTATMAALFNIKVGSKRAEEEEEEREKRVLASMPGCIPPLARRPTPTPTPRSTFDLTTLADYAGDL